MWRGKCWGISLPFGILGLGGEGGASRLLLGYAVRSGWCA